MAFIKVVCAIIAKEGKLLVCKRSEQMSNPGLWEFPGGKIQEDESPESAIIRECMEELHITVKPILTGKAVKHQYPEIQIELIPIYCKITKGEMELSEHDQFRFVHNSLLKNYALSKADALLLDANNGFQTLVCGC